MSAVFGGVVAFNSQAPAATLVVTSPGDNVGDACGPNCTLGQAIAAANADDTPDTIVFDSTVFASKQTIYVGAGLPEITHDVSIIGPTTAGAGVTLQARDTQMCRIFEVQKGTVNIANLTMKGASSAVMVIRGNTTVTGCTFQGNVTGLWNVGWWRSPMNPNEKMGQAKDVMEYSTLTANNCTLVKNSCGAWNWTGTMTLNSCTITGNTMGIAGDESTQILSNCLVVGNLSKNLTTFPSVQPGDTTTFLQNDHNITEGTPTEVGLDPKGLQDNGGPTPTIALLAGSAATGAGVATSSTDQRGTPRPQKAGCDIGAFQTQPTPSKAAS